MKYEKHWEPRWLAYSALEALVLAIVICGDIACGMLFLLAGRYLAVQVVGAALLAAGALILERSLRLVIRGLWH